MKKKMIMRMPALGMALMLAIEGPAALEFGASEAFAAESVKSHENLEKMVIRNLDAYENMEIFAMFQDGHFEVISCGDRSELAENIETMADWDGVVLVQPNYEYETEALEINDGSFAEQWALYNDGSFTIEEEKNRYPVYENPFGRPAAPGEWRRKWLASDLVGVIVETELKQAVAGVDINMSQAWSLYGDGKRDVVVAMIDTGVDAGHEDLADALWVNADEIPGNGVDDDGNGYVDDVSGWNFYHNNNQIFTGEEDSHGTHGTGTIAASWNNGIGIAGIAPGNRVRVMALKALGGREGGGSTASLIRAIRYAEENGAVICNLSLTSTTNDAALYQAIAGSKMLFVVAAGNGDPQTGRGLDTDIEPCYPAAFDLDNIISVANLSFDGTLHSSSNYGGDTVDLAAPGSYILSTTPGNGYGYMTGTSMAAPMVSGAAALVYSYFDQVDVSDVKEILLSTVTPMESLQGKILSGGRLNVGAALSYNTEQLSRKGFLNAGTAPDQGTAPFIESRIFSQDGGRFLLIRVLDIDGDLARLLYAKGNLTADQFSDGSVGKPFTINDKDLATFQADNAGIYTFYAEDSKGNRTVKTVEIADMSEGPGAY